MSSSSCSGVEQQQQRSSHNHDTVHYHAAIFACNLMANLEVLVDECMHERSMAWCLQDNSSTSRSLLVLGKALRNKVMQWCNTEAFGEKVDKYLDILYEEFAQASSVDATWVHKVFEDLIFGPHLEGLSSLQQHQGKILLLDLQDMVSRWNTLAKEP